MCNFIKVWKTTNLSKEIEIGVNNNILDFRSDWILSDDKDLGLYPGVTGLGQKKRSIFYFKL